MERYSFRHIARIILEAETPIAVGCGKKDIITDALVARDANGLPYIPGTGIAGIIRHTSGPLIELMGDQDNGSRLSVSEGRLLGPDGVAVDGLMDWNRLSANERSFLEQFLALPVRQHVRIGHKGTAENHGKFDEEVVLKGARFCFEMELCGTEAGEEKAFDSLLALIGSEEFHIGGKSRRGFGKMKAVSIKRVSLDLKKPDELSDYLRKSSSLKDEWIWSNVADANLMEDKPGWQIYSLTLKPEDFIIFNSGAGDEKSDIAYLREISISWNDAGRAMINSPEDSVVIPGSSVKGAIEHRTRYHLNRICKCFSDEEDGRAAQIVDDAMDSLFGKAGDTLNKGKRGNVIIPDIVTQTNGNPYIFRHCKVDRFTGGTIESALFDEEVLFANGDEYLLTLSMKTEKVPEDAIDAFERALKDICRGTLPLGGMTQRGHGSFTGSLIKNGEIIYG